MNEIFRVDKSSVSLHGNFPIRIVAACPDNPERTRDVFATCILISKSVEKGYQLTTQNCVLRGAMGENLPEHDWAKVASDEIADIVSEKWMDSMVENADVYLKEYLRVKGPLVWSESSSPKDELIRIALYADETFVVQLEAVVSKIECPKASDAVREALNLRKRVVKQ